MKRYTMFPIFLFDEVIAEEDAKGAWVRYEDAQAHAIKHGVKCATEVGEGGDERYQKLMDEYMALKAQNTKLVSLLVRFEKWSDVVVSVLTNRAP